MFKPGDEVLFKLGIDAICPCGFEGTCRTYVVDSQGDKVQLRFERCGILRWENRDDVCLIPRFAVGDEIRVFAGDQCYCDGSVCIAIVAGQSEIGVVELKHTKCKKHVWTSPLGLERVVRKCECGAHKVGTTHSLWCPARCC